MNTRPRHRTRIGGATALAVASIALTVALTGNAGALVGEEPTKITTQTVGPISVRPGSTGNLAAACPAGHAAIGGAYIVNGLAFTVAAGTTANLEAYVASIAVPPTTVGAPIRAAKFTVKARCVKRRVPLVLP
jgi:hypothetical protein